MKIFELLSISTLLISLTVSCQKDGQKKENDSAPRLNSQTSLTFLFNPSSAIEKMPNLFELTLKTPNDPERPKILVSRRGEIGSIDSLIKIPNLPSADGVSIKINLYLESFSPNTVTHLCESIELINLVADQTTSVSLSCYEITSAGKSGPIKLIYKVATVNASLDRKSVV